MKYERKVVILVLGGAPCFGPYPTLAVEVFITCSCLGCGIEFLHLCPCSLACLHDTLYHQIFTLLTLSTCDNLPFVHLFPIINGEHSFSCSFLRNSLNDSIMCVFLSSSPPKCDLLSKSAVHNVIVPDNLCTRNWIFFYCCSFFSFAVTRHLTVALCA